jgi:crotonobetainyl-CoA:carnitine CoA-transferase CaiB-like acyl-CoA transferase
MKRERTVSSEPKAFSGLRVVDLTQGVAGPHCTMLLAQHGADVIKIEPLEGDWSRTLGDLRGDHGGHSVYFNRGKRSIALNLKHPDGIAIVRKLTADAHVFGESFRPGVIKRLGLGYEAIKAMNEKIVYFSVSGFGQEGPFSTRPTVDTLIQAFSGMMVMNRTPDGVPHRQGMIAVDVLTGLYGFQAVSAAITKQVRFGIGSFIDNSMMLATAAFQGAKLMEHAISDGNPPPLYVPAGMFKTSNGYIVVSSMRKHHFTVLMELIGHPEIPKDPRMQTHESRIRNAPLINKALAEAFPAKSTEEWLKILIDAGVFAERVNNYQDYLDHPHTKAVHGIDWIEQDGVGKLPVVRTPGLPRPANDQPTQHAPHIGEQGRVILGEIGYSSGDIDRLIKDGAVGAPSQAAKAAE